MFFRKSKKIKKLVIENETNKMLIDSLKATINDLENEKYNYKGQLRVQKANNTKILNKNEKLEQENKNLEKIIKSLKEDFAEFKSKMTVEPSKRKTTTKKTTKKETTSKNTTSKK